MHYLKGYLTDTMCRYFLVHTMGSNVNVNICPLVLLSCFEGLVQAAGFASAPVNLHKAD